MVTEEGGGVMVQGVWDLAEGSHYTIDLPSFVLGLGLALGLGGGGGVASERARVCGGYPIAYILGQIQHECASLTPRTDNKGTKADGGSVPEAGVHGAGGL